MNFERYRLVLYHDMIIDGDVISLDKPITTQYILQIHNGSKASVPVVVNGMIESLKKYMLNSLGRVTEGD